MTIKVSMAAAVAGGETLSDAFSLDVAHTSLSETIAGGGHLVFSLQPVSGDRVKLLFLTADKYENLTYQIQTDGTAPTDPLGLNLTEPQLLIGDTVNAVQPTPSHLAFWNAGPENIKVNIMVGIDAVVSATPLPPPPVSGGPSSSSRRSASVSGRSGESALEKSLEEAKTKLAGAQKAKAAKKKPLELNQDIEAIQKVLAKARKG
jgi:hypothetical protein